MPDWWERSNPNEPFKDGVGDLIKPGNGIPVMTGNDSTRTVTNTREQTDDGLVKTRVVTTTRTSRKYKYPKEGESLHAQDEETFKDLEPSSNGNISPAGTEGQVRSDLSSTARLRPDQIPYMTAGTIESVDHKPCFKPLRRYTLCQKSTRISKDDADSIHPGWRDKYPSKLIHVDSEESVVLVRALHLEEERERRLGHVIEEVEEVTPTSGICPVCGKNRQHLAYAQCGHHLCVKCMCAYIHVEMKHRPGGAFCAICRKQIKKISVNFCTSEMKSKEKSCCNSLKLYNLKYGLQCDQ